MDTGSVSASLPVFTPMLKKLIRRYLPHDSKVREHKHLQLFGTLLHQPDLWHLNRRSVSGAFAVGLFVAFIPVPFQMVLAGGAAITMRVNLPISVALVWVTNPLTMPPIFYFCYRVGAAVLDTPPLQQGFQPSVGWVMSELGAIWEPFLLGSLIVGSASAVLSYLFVRVLWRWHIVRQLRAKRGRRMVCVAAATPVAGGAPPNPDQTRKETLSHRRGPTSSEGLPQR